VATTTGVAAGEDATRVVEEALGAGRATPDEGIGGTWTVGEMQRTSPP